MKEGSGWKGEEKEMSRTYREEIAEIGTFPFLDECGSLDNLKLRMADERVNVSSLCSSDGMGDGVRANGRRGEVDYAENATGFVVGM